MNNFAQLQRGSQLSHSWLGMGMLRSDCEQYSFEPPMMALCVEDGCSE